MLQSEHAVVLYVYGHLVVLQHGYEIPRFLSQAGEAVRYLVEVHALVQAGVEALLQRLGAVLDVVVEAGPLGYDQARHRALQGGLGVEVDEQDLDVAVDGFLQARGVVDARGRFNYVAGKDAEHAGGHAAHLGGVQLADGDGSGLAT